MYTPLCKKCGGLTCEDFQEAGFDYEKNDLDVEKNEDAAEAADLDIESFYDLEDINNSGRIQRLRRFFKTKNSTLLTIHYKQKTNSLL